jgi:hypothetical protein
MVTHADAAPMSNKDRKAGAAAEPPQQHAPPTPAANLIPIRALPAEQHHPKDTITQNPAADAPQKDTTQEHKTQHGQDDADEASDRKGNHIPAGAAGATTKFYGRHRASKWMDKTTMTQTTMVFTDDADTVRNTARHDGTTITPVIHCQGGAPDEGDMASPCGILHDMAATAAPTYADAAPMSNKDRNAGTAAEPPHQHAPPTQAANLIPI